MFTTALYLLLALTSYEAPAKRQAPQTFEPQSFAEEFEATADAPCFIVETPDGVTDFCQ